MFYYSVDKTDLFVPMFDDPIVSEELIVNKTFAQMSFPTRWPNDYSGNQSGTFAMLDLPKFLFIQWQSPICSIATSWYSKIYSSTKVEQLAQVSADTTPRDWYGLGQEGANAETPYDIPLYWLISNGLIIRIPI